MSNNPSGKDVIYIDIDDEITTIIDKVRSAEQRIVALVLPKRATAFQSIVNMKLLKRSADESKKHLVLITSEAGILPLAGAVGLYVAKSLQSRPEVPVVPGGHVAPGADTEESVNMATEPALDKTRPVGDYAGAAAGGGTLAADDESPIELDNSTPAAAAGGAAAGAAKKAGKKDKKLKIPDFNKFRTWMIIGGAALVSLIFFLYLALAVMPKAKILVKTDSSAISANLDVTLSTSTEKVDEESAIIPARQVETIKSANTQVPATGEKDKGTKAGGEVTLSLKNCDREEVVVPAGTGITSNGLTFITQQSATLNSVKVGNKCQNSVFTDFSTKSVDVIAQSAGEKFNVGSTSFTVAGYSGVSADGGPMAGGTTNIVKVVSQADIDGAKQKLSEQDAATVKDQLKKQLRSQGLFAVEDTFIAANPEVNTTAKVGDEVANVTVTQKSTYTMYGAKEADLKKIIAFEVNKEIDESKQAIIDYGLSEATFKAQNQQGKSAMVTMQATAIAGSDLNLTEIKEKIAGKKSNDAKQIIGNYPGVTNVEVSYSPFWVSSIPKKASKITVTVEKPVVKNAE